MTLLSSPSSAAAPGAPGAPASSIRKWLPWGVLLVAVALALVFGLGGHSSKPTLDAQAAHIASELKCPVCHGETVAESESSVSVEIRAEIRQDLVKGESEQQIISGFEADYGPGILERPSTSGVGLLVWLLPVLGVVFAGAGLGLAFRRWRKAGPAPGPSEPPSAEPPSAGPPSSGPGTESSPDVAGDPPVVEEVGAPEDETGEAPAETASVGTDSLERRTRRTKVLVSCTGAVIIAAGAAWALVGSTSQRQAGEAITGQALGNDAINADLQAAQNDEQKNPPDLADAVKQYQAVLNAAPNQVEALTGEGWVLVETGQPSLFQQGLDLLKRAEDVDSTYGPAHLYRGLAFLAERDYQSSVPELQWYLDHDPDPSLASNVRAKLAQAQAAAKTEAPAG